MSDIDPSSKYRSISGDIDESEKLQLSLRGRTFLGFRVVIGTTERSVKDLLIRCPNTLGGMYILVLTCYAFFDIIIAIL